MNKAQALRKLAEALVDFQCHPYLTQAIIDIIKGSGYEARFFNLLITRLKFLNEYRTSAHNHHKEFERLNQNIYSFHLDGRDFNIRILYSFILDDKPVLLDAFYERQGKSDSDYTKPIEVAAQRLDVFRKEYYK